MTPGRQRQSPAFQCLDMRQIPPVLIQASQVLVKCDQRADGREGGAWETMVRGSLRAETAGVGWDMVGGQGCRGFLNHANQPAQARNQIRRGQTSAAADKPLSPWSHACCGRCLRATFIGPWALALATLLARCPCATAGCPRPLDGALTVQAMLVSRCYQRHPRLVKLAKLRQ